MNDLQRSALGSALLLSLTAACGVEERVGGETSARTTARVAEAAVPIELDATARATLAGGCFWCMEKPFEKVPGVAAVISGYTGGHVDEPTYEAVCAGITGHAEAIQVHYDPNVVSYGDLLEVFWRQIDPTDAGGQFVDRGTQYRSAIFVHDEAQREVAQRSREALAESGRYDGPIVTEIVEFERFWDAEAYHQDYYRTNPDNYHRYRSGSGRDAYLDAVWGEERHWLPTPRASAVSRWAGFELPSERELRERLTALQYRVTQEDGTERPFDNEYWDEHRAGIFVDVVSGEPLFSSLDKFESGTGWPSFTRPLVAEHIAQDVDHKLGYPRDEVRSRFANSHLGHVFNDGPQPTGLRYCINSAALRFVPVEQLAEQGYGQFAGLFAENAAPSH